MSFLLNTTVETLELLLELSRLFVETTVALVVLLLKLVTRLWPVTNDLLSLELNRASAFLLLTRLANGLLDKTPMLLFQDSFFFASGLGVITSSLEALAGGSSSASSIISSATTLCDEPKLIDLKKR